MRIAPLLLGLALTGACTRQAPDAPKPPVDRQGVDQARSAVADAENAVLTNRVHALEIEVARIENAPETAKVQLLNDRLKALELKVYAAAPDAPAAAAATPDRPARPTSVGRRSSLVNPFPTYRRPTQAEREAAEKLAH